MIGRDGLILTIGYLLLEAETIEVITQDERILPARQVAYDLATGFGLIRPLVPLRGIEPVPLAGIASLKVGQPLLVATGSSGGTEVGFTRLVGMRPFSGYWEYHIEEAIFTSPPIANHSGASLFNSKGELLGIGSLFVLEAGGPDQTMPGNMFVPVDLLRPVLGEMATSPPARTRARRPSMARPVVVRSATATWRSCGSTVQARQLAAGLQPGDVVLEVDGVQVESRSRPSTSNSGDARGRHGVRRASSPCSQGSEVRKIKVHAIDRMQTLRKPEGV